MPLGPGYNHRLSVPALGQSGEGEHSSGRFLCYALGYYPAAGYRLSGTGAFGVVTTNGYWWSASQAASSATGACYLYVGSSNVHLSYSAAHSYGIPVRCVAAF